MISNPDAETSHIEEYVKFQCNFKARNIVDMSKNNLSIEMKKIPLRIICKENNFSPSEEEEIINALLPYDCVLRNCFTEIINQKLDKKYVEWGNGSYNGKYSKDSVAKLENVLLPVNKIQVAFENAVTDFFISVYIAYNREIFKQNFNIFDSIEFNILKNLTKANLAREIQLFAGINPTNSLMINQDCQSEVKQVENTVPEIESSLNNSYCENASRLAVNICRRRDPYLQQVHNAIYSTDYDFIVNNSKEYFEAAQDYALFDILPKKPDYGQENRINDRSATIFNESGNDGFPASGFKSSRYDFANSDLKATATISEITTTETLTQSTTPIQIPSYSATISQYPVFIPAPQFGAYPANSNTARVSPGYVHIPVQQQTPIVGIQQTGMPYLNPTFLRIQQTVNQQAQLKYCTTSPQISMLLKGSLNETYINNAIIQQYQKLNLISSVNNREMFLYEKTLQHAQKVSKSEVANNKTTEKPKTVQQKKSPQGAKKDI